MLESGLVRREILRKDVGRVVEVSAISCVERNLDLVSGGWSLNDGSPWVFFVAWEGRKKDREKEEKKRIMNGGGFCLLWDPDF